MENFPTLLVVDDEPIVRALLVSALNDSGYKVVETMNGDDAMKVIDNSEHLSGIITDISLGSGANGWKVGRYARDRFPKVAVVYMTGDSSAEWKAERVADSIVLIKPFRLARLATAVSTLLNLTDQPVE